MRIIIHVIYTKNIIQLLNNKSNTMKNILKEVSITFKQIRLPQFFPCLYSKCQTKISAECFIPLTFTYIYYEPSKGTDLNRGGEAKTKNSRAVDKNLKCQTKIPTECFISRTITYKYSKSNLGTELNLAEGIKTKKSSRKTVRYSKCQTKASVEGFIPTITYIYLEPNTGSDLNLAGENKTKKSRELERNFNSKCQTKPSVQGFTSSPRPHLNKGSKYSRCKRLNKSCLLYTSPSPRD